MSAPDFSAVTSLLPAGEVLVSSGRQDQNSILYYNTFTVNVNFSFYKRRNTELISKKIKLRPLDNEQENRKTSSTSSLIVTVDSFRL